MEYLYKRKKTWMPSISVSLNQKVSTQDANSVQLVRNKTTSQNVRNIDDEKLRYMIKTITLEMITDLKSELKALAEKFDKLDSKYNRLE